MPRHRKNYFLFLILLISANAIAQSASDIAGRWQGSFDIPLPDGTVQHDTSFLILETNGATLTGSAGRAQDTQTAISNGSVHGDDLTFSVEVRPGTIVKFELRRVTNHLVGTAIGVPNQIKPIKVDVTRAPAPNVNTLLHNFMGAIYIQRNGHVLLDHAYGFANLEWQVSNATTSKFRIGSLTKQFTAASILLLAQRHRLQLDDRISQYIAGAPSTWRDITIMHLLTHSSGIVSLTDLPADEATLTRGGTPVEIIARFRDKALLFAPGTQNRYSNSGYILLAMIIEKVSGQTYAAFLAQNLFEPLAMHDTGIDEDAEVIPRRASGYRYEGTTPKRADFLDMRVPFGAGDLYSTTGDLSRWEDGLFGGKILQAAWLEKMTTSTTNGFGLGVMSTTEEGHRLISHTGGIQGFVSDLRRYPDDDVTVIVLSNSESRQTLQLSQLLAKQALSGKLDIATAQNSLNEEIVDADGKLFDAYNTCDIESFSSSLSNDLEFFHDKTGLTNQAWNVRALRQKCAESTKYRRELDMESVQVFLVPGYGALEIGIHRFYEQSGGTAEKLDASPKFANVWKQTPEGWKLARVLSYGH